MATKAQRAVICDLRGCDNPLPKGRRRYCSDKCQQNAIRRRYRAKKRNMVAIDSKRKPINDLGITEVRADGRVSARRPPDHFIEDGWFDLVAAGEMTRAQVARRLETTEGNVSRWMEWVRRDRMAEAQQDEWEMGPEAKRALVDFRYFRNRYFKVARGPKSVKGKPPHTTVFHERWIKAILDALPEESGGTGAEGVGKQLAICCPPRHGKSLLLAHFVIWLILRNPDICILWSALNENIARRFGSLIRDELETNDKLALEFLGPGRSFKPETRTGAQWRDDEFEVSTRTNPQPAPTFKGIGKTGKILSMDADLLVCDDLEDDESTATPAGREATQNRMNTDLASRKEEHTAWVYIGSRQHPDDLLHQLIGNEEWEVIVETAHDPDCELPWDDEAAHVDCVLWPGVRTFRYLMQKLRTVGERIFQMQYLSDPVGEGVVVFVDPLLRACLDHSRVLGQIDLPAGYELLGTIDPSPSHNQVRELWAWSREKPGRYLIDIDVATRGGMDAWEDGVKEWLELYGLRRWVCEANALQSDYVNRREFAKWRAEVGVHVHPHITGRNKSSIGMGVGSMVPLYANKDIILPYGNDVTRGKIDAFIREHVQYDPDRPQKAAKWRIDRVAAAWFANVYIDTLQGGRLDGEADDDTPDWLVSDAEDWLDTDTHEGWFA